MKIKSLIYSVLIISLSLSVNSGYSQAEFQKLIYDDFNLSEFPINSTQIATNNSFAFSATAYYDAINDISYLGMLTYDVVVGKYGVLNFDEYITFSKEIEVTDIYLTANKAFITINDDACIIEVDIVNGLAKKHVINGLDRINSIAGYSNGNIIVCGHYETGAGYNAAYIIFDQTLTNMLDKQKSLVESEYNDVEVDEHGYTILTGTNYADGNAVSTKFTVLEINYSIKFDFIINVDEYFNNHRGIAVTPSANGHYYVAALVNDRDLCVYRIDDVGDVVKTMNYTSDNYDIYVKNIVSIEDEIYINGYTLVPGTTISDGFLIKLNRGLDLLYAKHYYTTLTNNEFFDDLLVINGYPLSFGFTYHSYGISVEKGIWPNWMVETYSEDECMSSNFHDIVTTEYEADKSEASLKLFFTPLGNTVISLINKTLLAENVICRKEGAYRMKNEILAEIDDCIVFVDENNLSISSTSLIYSYSVVSSTGQEVLSLSNLSDYAVRASVSKLPVGIYIVRVLTEHGESTKKILLM